MPLPVENVVQELTAFAVVLFAEQFLSVCPDDEPTSVVVELVVYIFLVGRQIQKELIAAGMLNG